MKLLKPSLTASLLLATLFTTQSGVTYAQDWRNGAEGREVDCKLVVKGKTYLNGTCMYDADRDGSFRLFGNKYFVYLNTFGDGTAGASWNGVSQASHAQEPLGEGFKRNGACWSNKTAKVCAWDKQASAPQGGGSSAATPIKFARGAYSTIVTGKLNGYDAERNYTIEVGRGQTMSVKQVDMTGNRYVSVYLTDPNGDDANDLDASCHSQATVSPTMAGTYAIKVVECQKADPWKGSYSLKVTVK